MGSGKREGGDEPAQVVYALLESHRCSAQFQRYGSV